MEEAKTQENAKMQSALQEMELQFKEIKDMLIKERETAREAAEEVLLKERESARKAAEELLQERETAEKVLLKERETARETSEELILKEREAAEKVLLKEREAAEEALLKEREATRKAVEEALLKEREIAEEALLKEREIAKETLLKEREEREVVEEALLKEREAAKDALLKEREVREAAEEALLKEREEREAAEEALLKERETAEEALLKEQEVREAAEEALIKEREAAEEALLKEREAARKAVEEALLKERETAEEALLKEREAAKEALLKEREEREVAEESLLREREAAEDALLNEREATEEALLKEREFAEEALLKEREEQEATEEALLKVHETARKVAEEREATEEALSNEQEIATKAAEEFFVKEQETARKAAEEVLPIIKEVPVLDTSLMDKLFAENEKLKDLVSSLEKKIDETEKKYEETTRVSEERLKKALEAESKINDLNIAMQRLQEKLSNLEYEDKILRQRMSAHLSPAGSRKHNLENGHHVIDENKEPHGAPANKSYGKSDSRLRRSHIEPLPVLSTPENVDALLKCVVQNIGFSEGKPIAAITIYKCLLHWRSFEAERTSVFDRLVQMIGSKIEKEEMNNHLAYWLSNASTLLFLLLKSHKPGCTYGKPPPPTSLFGRMTQSFRASSSSLPFDASSVVRHFEAKYPALLFKEQLEAYVDKIFGMIRDNTKKELTSLLSLCIQEPKSKKENVLKESEGSSGNDGQSSPLKESGGSSGNEGQSGRPKKSGSSSDNEGQSSSPKKSGSSSDNEGPSSPPKKSGSSSDNEGPSSPVKESGGICVNEDPSSHLKESEVSSGYEGQSTHLKDSGDSFGNEDQTSPWQGIIKSLNNLLQTLQENFVTPVLIQKIFTQLFSFINVQLFNSLLQRRECLSFSNGEYVKSGLADLELWCGHAKPEYTGSSWDELKHIRQAVGFLVIFQKGRVTYDDIVNDLCPILNGQQLYRICTQYWDDKFDTHSVSADVLSSMKESMPEDSNDPDSTSFLLDDYSSIPFSLEDVSTTVNEKDFKDVVHENDFKDVEPVAELLDNPAFQFLQE